MSSAGRPKPVRAATVAPTLVPLESSYQATPRALGDELQPVRQALEAAQALRQRLARCAQRARERAGGECVGDVVRAVDLQFAHRQHRQGALVQHAVHDAPMPGPGGRAEAEAHLLAPGEGERHASAGRRG